MVSNKTMLISSIILSAGIIAGGSLISSKSTPVSSPISEKIDMKDTIFLDSKEAAKLLGITEKELLKIIAEEKRMLETTGSFEGEMLPYVMIEQKRYFERTKLIMWAQESAAQHKEY
ncbi:hypothetical protein [Neobacillus niacini]|uniref:hypothetical protein n=1 Tax=Neobacillus niacini TaxID=86668 RepID=UPI00398305E6